MPKKKPSPAQDTLQTAPNFEYARSPDFRVIYSNNLKANSSPTEVRLTFSNFTDDVGIGKFVIQEEVCITIHPGMVRLLLAQIEATLQNHERLWGEIKLPTGMAMPDFKAILDAASKEEK